MLWKFLSVKHSLVLFFIQIASYGHQNKLELEILVRGEILFNHLSLATTSIIIGSQDNYHLNK